MCIRDRFIPKLVFLALTISYVDNDIGAAVGTEIHAIRYIGVSYQKGIACPVL